MIINLQSEYNATFGKACANKPDAISTAKLNIFCISKSNLASQNMKIQSGLAFKRKIS